MLIGCSGDLSVVDPAGPAARAIATLWWVMFIGAGLILALVAALVIGAFRTPRQAENATRDEKVWIIGLGLCFSIAVLAALLAYGLVTGERLMPRAAADLVRVEADAPGNGLGAFPMTTAPAMSPRTCCTSPPGGPSM